MRKLFFLIFLLMTTTVFSQNYNWKKVDSLINKALYRDAQKLTENIYHKALEQEDCQNIVRSYLYLGRIMNFYQENATEKLINLIEKDLDKLNQPCKAISEGLLAYLYYGYYQSNESEILDRTYIPQQNKPLEQWSVRDFANRCHELFSKALAAQKDLVKFKVKDFPVLFKEGNLPEELRPTMFDFIAYWAIEFYTDKVFSLTFPRPYLLDEPQLFASAETFVKLNLGNDQNLYAKRIVLQIYQKLLQQHLSDGNLPALVDADLHRILFVYKNYTGPNRDSLYEQALKELIDKYPQVYRTDFVKVQLAKFYVDKAAATHDQKYFTLALDLCNQLKNSKDEQAAQQASALVNMITRQELAFLTVKVLPSEQNFLLHLVYRNFAGKLYLRVYKFKYTGAGLEQKEFLNRILSSDLISEQTLAVPKVNDNFEHSVDFVVKGLPVGDYTLVVSQKQDFALDSNNFYFQQLKITDLSFVWQSFYNKLLLWVTDRDKGYPLQGVQASLFYRYGDFDLTAKKLTDQNGRVWFEPKSDYWIWCNLQLNKGNDSFERDNLVFSKSSYNKPKSSPKVRIFLDRKIYRPGQIVYFKGLVYKDGGKDDIELLNNYLTKLEFYDANGKLVKTMQIYSDDYGSFNGQFVIPQTGLTGRWRIYTDHGGGENFLVEEYKRPQFKVEILPVEGTLLPGQIITIHGKAVNYNGLPVSGANVELTARMKKATWWYFWSRSSREFFTKTLHAVTDDNGDFVFTFQLEQMPKDADLVVYDLLVKVTDINGETHSANYSFVVGKHSVFLTGNIPQWAEVDKDLVFDAQVLNSDGQQLKQLKLNYTIELLKPPSKKPLIEKLWDDPDQQVYTQKQWQELMPYCAFKNWQADPQKWEREKIVAKGQAKSSQTLKYKPGKPGIYRIVFTVKDPVLNDTVKFSKIVRVFDRSSSKSLAPIPFYVHKLTDSLKPGQKAVFIVGSGWPNAKVLMQITYNNKIVQETWLDLNSAQRKIEFDITDDMLGGVGVNLYLVKHNRQWYKHLEFAIPYPSRQLDVKVEHFTDKLEPGQQETWSFVISKQNGQKALAQVLASMYDKSLDAFIPNNWNFNILQAKNSLKKFSVDDLASTDVFYGIYFLRQPSFYTKTFNYYTFNWYGYKPVTYYLGRQVFFRTFTEAKPMTKQTASEPPQPTPMEEEVNFSDVVPAQSEHEQTEQVEQQQVYLRKNFSETAFFYPSLMTNDSGEVVITFKVPQSLTAWKFQLLAHTKDLNYGYLSKVVTTTKQLMLFPNVPRFVRQGDTIMFSAKVANASDIQQDVSVTLEVRNARTNEILQILHSPSSQNLMIKPGQTKNIAWKLIIPDDLVDPIVYTVIAKSENYSDGQQDMIPVLSNRILVTETKPLPVNGGETKTFVINSLFDKHSTTAKPYKLTFEFNSNPLWYALISLPYLMTYPHECNEQLFSRFYANSIATYIINSSPDIKRVLQIWQKTKAQALVSELEKKQQLKQIVLDATPWLLEGQNETEQRKRLALLLNLNNMANEQQQALQKLFKAQNPDGGWPWFKGGESSWYITQYILTGFARLKDKGVYDYSKSKYNKNVIKAVEYTDDKIRQYYYELKKWLKPDQMSENHLTPLVVQYLYMRGFYENIFKGKSDTVFDYFYGQLKRYWTDLNLYSQAQAAITFYNYGDKKLAQNVISSLKQRALYDQELGYYWAANKPGWLWYQAPIETQAMIIEAFNRLTNDTNFVEGAKRWLLKQKQTTHWPTTKSTTEAVWALIFTGYNWLAEKQPVEIQIGNIKLPQPQDQVEAGTGYLQKVWPGSQISKDMGKIIVKNPNKHPAWGAVYYQYFENIDKVQAANTQLQIQRQIYKLVRDSLGEHLQSLSPEQALAVGDEVVVRLVIKTDRDMDYVHIKDLRPTGFEPAEQLSGYVWKGGLGYYRSIRDASANFFIEHLAKGTYVFEYRLYATIAGSLSGGLTTIQCMYAPEFSAHSAGQRVSVKQE